MTTAIAAPGQDRVIRFQINGHDFAFRRPSRADVGEAANLTALKLFVTGAPQLMNELDGANCQWEARLEVGLMPRIRKGQALNLGETAPRHWLEPIFDGEGKPTSQQRITFEDVDPDEFAAVVDHLTTVLGLKVDVPAGPSSEGGLSIGIR